MLARVNPTRSLSALAQQKPQIGARPGRAPSARASPATDTMATVQEYIDKHSLQKKVEDVLNTCVSQKPSDPLAFMVGCRWGGAAQCGGPPRAGGAARGRACGRRPVAGLGR